MPPAFGKHQDYSPRWQRLSVSSVRQCIKGPKPHLTSQGAGPSGLVAAKTLVHDHPKDTFHVTVFEALDRLGGLWPVSEQDDGMVNPDMCTNQSRHTVSFSDLAWPESVPAFPKAWQVGQYLERYVRTYPGYEIRKNCKIVKADLKDGKWIVQTHSSKSELLEETREFDHLIVSTGFFGKPKVHKTLAGFQAPVLHSSQVRDVKDLLMDGGKPSSAPGRNIVVVGGQMSGVEIAASIAIQLSSAETTPGDSDVPNASEYWVTHIVQNPIWVMTLFYPKDPVLDVAGSDGEQSKVSHLICFAIRQHSNSVLTVSTGIKQIPGFPTRGSSLVQLRVATRRASAELIRLHFTRSSKYHPRLHEHLSRH